MAYNSYLIVDDKTVLMDTVDSSVAGIFFENVRAALNGRKLDYVVVQHMEPDHSATLEGLLLRYPEVRVITNQKTVGIIKQFFDFDIDSRVDIVKEGDSFSTGAHELSFVMAPMVHWPEVMLTYDKKDKILFSADAFGSFGALNGNIFMDPDDYPSYVDEARRYYSNIVGKYGAQVQAVLKKASALDIDIIAPLHGYVWREGREKILASYNTWSSFEPEIRGVAVIYGSIYGGSQTAAEIIAGKLSDEGIKTEIIDVTAKHTSYSVSAAYKYDRIVLVSPTVDGGIFSRMENTVSALASHGLQNRTVAVVDNGTWAPVAGKKIVEMLSSCKNMTFIEEGFSFKSRIHIEDITKIDQLVKKLAE
jgi:flavorubredoxin